MVGGNASKGLDSSRMDPVAAGFAEVTAGAGFSNGSHLKALVGDNGAINIKVPKLTHFVYSGFADDWRFR